MDFSNLGPLVPDAEAKNIRTLLQTRLESHFSRDRSDSIPISCRIDPRERADGVQDDWFSGLGSVIVYMENYEVMIRTSAPAVLRFLKAREPWQDFDVCIFDDDISWCIALTHNDEAKRVVLAS